MNLSDIEDCEIAGVDRRDYPDYCDAYIERASWKSTGKDLTEEELDELHDKHSDWVYEEVMRQVHNW